MSTNQIIPLDSLDPAPSRNWIVYDGDCPWCSQIVRWRAVRNGLPEAGLISARDQEAPEVRWLREQGVKLNDAMALNDGGTLYTGSAALERILRLETMGRMNAIAPLLRPGFPGDLVYFFLKLGRGISLRILGRKPLGY